jgi:hypothetical protein
MRHVSIHILTGLPDANQVEISPAWKIGNVEGSTVRVQDLLLPERFLGFPSKQIMRAARGLIGSMVVMTHDCEFDENGLLIAHLQTRGLPIEWFLPIGMCLEIPTPNIEAC